jgi:hypothetical protein
VRFARFHQLLSFAFLIGTAQIKVIKHNLLVKIAHRGAANRRACYIASCSSSPGKGQNVVGERNAPDEGRESRNANTSSGRVITSFSKNNPLRSESWLKNEQIETSTE